MKHWGLTSVVFAGVAAWWDWRFGVAAIAILGAACAWLLQRLREQLILAELSARLQRSASVEEAWELVPRYLPRLLGRRRRGRLAPSAANRLAREVASRVDLAVDNLRVQEELRTRAIRDSLTGLFNRRWIEETMSGSAGHAGVILADVDHFKSFNDRWGHAGGDALLQGLARLMERLFRDENVVCCRLGGEEFVIILPDTSFEELRASAERLVEESRGLAVHLGGELLGAITISAGVAVSPHHASTIEELISAADRALYAAKRAGRDCVATPPHQVVGLDAA